MAGDVVIARQAARDVVLQNELLKFASAPVDRRVAPPVCPRLPRVLRGFAGDFDPSSPMKSRPSSRETTFGKPLDNEDDMRIDVDEWLSFCDAGDPHEIEAHRSSSSSSEGEADDSDDDDDSLLVRALRTGIYGDADLAMEER